MVNQLQFTNPQAYSGGADFSLLERLGYNMAQQREAEAINADAYRLMGGGQGQQSGGFLSDLGRKFGLIPDQPPPGAPPVQAAVGPTPQSTAGAGIGTMTPNAKSWFDFAIRPVADGGLGLTQAQAAGKVANLQAESTPDIKPWGVSGDAGTAHGSAQWRGPRLRNLVEFSRANGLDYRTTEAQQKFMRHEYLGEGDYGGGSERKAYGALSATNSPRDAATAVNRYYERSADKSGRREAGAARFAGAPVVARGGEPVSEGGFNELDAAANSTAWGANAPVPAGIIPTNATPSPLDEAAYPEGPVNQEASAQSRGFQPQAAPVAPLPSRDVAAPPQVAAAAMPEARVAQNLLSNQPAAAAGMEREQLAQMYRNPLTRPLATAMLQKMMDPGTWSYQQVGDKLVALNNKTGAHKVVMEDTKPLIVGGSLATRDDTQPSGYRFTTPPDTKPIHQKEDEVIHIPNGLGGYKTIGSGDSKAQREIASNTYKADVLQLTGKKREFMIANGKLPTSEDVAPGDRRKIDKLQDAIDAADSALITLGEMEKLNEQSFKGMGAGKRAYVAANVLPADSEWAKRGQATLELSNEMTRGALNQLKAVFTGSQSKEELAVLREVQGAIDNPGSMNANIFKRAKAILDQRQRKAEANQESIRTGEAYRPGARRQDEGDSSGVTWSIKK